MKFQDTRFDNLQRRISAYLATAIVGPWKRRSLGLISLLLGFYLGSNMTIYYLEQTGQRPIVVLSILVLTEILVRLRTNVKGNSWPLHWLVLDNVRIGLIYSIVLEAFKLGS